MIDSSDMTQGAAREFIRSSRVRAILFLIAMVTVVGIGWANDYQSCARSEAIRAAVRTSFIAQAHRAQQRSTVEHGLDRMLDIEAQQAALASASHVDPLDCARLLPPT